MGIYRARRLVNVRSGGNLVSDSDINGGSEQARCGPPGDDSSALHRWWAILDFWRHIISNQSEQAPGVGSDVFRVLRAQLDELLWPLSLFVSP
jgi:hypothetical protein